MIYKQIYQIKLWLQSASSAVIYEKLSTKQKETFRTLVLLSTPFPFRRKLHALIEMFSEKIINNSSKLKNKEK